MKKALLEVILLLGNVNTENWGTREAKTVNDLLEEINSGEACLQIKRDEVTRIISIVKMHVKSSRFPGRVLFEDYIILPDKRQIKRGQEPSGKMRPEESPIQTVIRKTFEELQVPQDQITIRQEHTSTEEKASESFPELKTQYQIHHFQVVLSSACEAARQATFRIKKKDGSINAFSWQ